MSADPIERFLARASEEAAPLEPSPVALATARCLATPDGVALLAHLKAQFSDRRAPPSASDAELRHLEGARCVVDHIVRLKELGAMQETIR